MPNDSKTVASLNQSFDELERLLVLTRQSLQAYRFVEAEGWFQAISDRVEEGRDLIGDLAASERLAVRSG